MKRASFVAIALLVAGCRFPTSGSPARAIIEPARTNVAASAYSFARKSVLESLATQSATGEPDWTIAPTSIEAGVRQDNFDRSLYRVVFSGSKSGFPPRSWFVTLRRSAGDWILVKIET